MEGVVAARRLRKSMLQGNYLENSNEKRHHVKSNYKVNEKEETNGVFYSIKSKIVIKSIITVTLLIICSIVKLLYKGNLENNQYIKVIVEEYKKDFSKEETLNYFEEKISTIYGNINYLFPDKLVELVTNNYENSIKPYILNFSFSNMIKKDNGLRENVIIYNESKESEVSIYNEEEKKDEPEKVEEIGGMGGGNETLEDSSSINNIDEEVSKIKELGIEIKWPVKGTITSKYGEREEIFKDIGKYHTGLDIANKSNTEIFSATSGTVTKIEYNNKYYGNNVEITTNGVVFKYAHLNEILTSEGKTVDNSRVIGKMGSTGYSTGPHLHFEIRYENKTIDPEKLLP